MTIEVATLANGLRVAGLAMPGLRTAAVSLAAGCGARHEGEAENGLAHLFEHMLFKGTRVRSARAIAEAIEDVGGSLNAWTSRDGTVFHGRVLARDIPLAVDLLADLVSNPRFAEADLALEKEVIRSEIGEAADVPEDLVFDLLQEAAFPDQPLGRPILGTEESLARLDCDSLSHWRTTHYRAPGLALVAAGAVDHAELVALAESALGGLDTTPPPTHRPARWGGGTRAEKRRSEQAHVAIGFAGPGLHDPAHYAAQLFATALGGGMSSRLFQELREERGLAYSVSAAHVPHADTGLTSIYLAARPKAAADTADRALAIAHALSADLSQAELDRARAQLKAGLLMGLESCAAQADWIGRTLLAFGRAIPPAEVEAAIDAVTLEEARAAGAALLAQPAARACVAPRAVFAG
ncbi:MAG: pitrilysin family protein [Sphingomonadaceae bacterium]